MAFCIIKELVESILSRIAIRPDPDTLLKIDMSSKRSTFSLKQRVSSFMEIKFEKELTSEITLFKELSSVSKAVNTNSFCKV